VGAGNLVSAEERRRLWRAIDELPPKQRLVLELRVYDELPFREVAEIAGCSENAAKVNFHHAVKRLRESLR
jgi:RNA polymerase sigma-70 factor (ECF subfamily)